MILLICTTRLVQVLLLLWATAASDAKVIKGVITEQLYSHKNTRGASNIILHLFLWILQHRRGKNFALVFVSNPTQVRTIFLGTCYCKSCNTRGVKIVHMFLWVLCQENVSCIEDCACKIIIRPTYITWICKLYLRYSLGIDINIQIHYAVWNCWQREIWCETSFIFNFNSHMVNTWERRAFHTTR